MLLAVTDVHTVMGGAPHIQIISDQKSKEILIFLRAAFSLPEKLPFSFYQLLYCQSKVYCGGSVSSVVSVEGTASGAACPKTGAGPSSFLLLLIHENPFYVVFCSTEGKIHSHSTYVIMKKRIKSAKQLEKMSSPNL